MLGFLAVGLALLRAVDPAEADAFRALVVQDLYGVAIEDEDYLSPQVFIATAIEIKNTDRPLPKMNLLIFTILTIFVGPQLWHPGLVGFLAAEALDRL